jgi:hypothetical protein
MKGRVEPQVRCGVQELGTAYLCDPLPNEEAENLSCTKDNAKPSVLEGLSHLVDLFFKKDVIPGG